MTTRFFCFATSAALGLALLTAGGIARAQDVDAPPGVGGIPSTSESSAGLAPVIAPRTWIEGSDYNSRGLTPHAGAIAARLDAVVNLSKGVEGEPVNLSPAVYYGVSDKLAVGVTTNVHGEIWGFGNGWFGSVPAPNGLCLGGQDHGCPKVFDNIALDALYTFLRQPGTEAALHLGLDMVSLDPAALSAHIGAMAKFRGGPIAVLIDPSLQIGITKRDSGNKEVLYVPVRVGFQTTPDLNVGLVTGLAGATSNFSEQYTIPLGISGLFSVSQAINVGAYFVFPNMAGKNHSSDDRTLGVVLNLRR